MTIKSNKRTAEDKMCSRISNPWHVSSFVPKAHREAGLFALLRGHILFSYKFNLYFMLIVIDVDECLNFIQLLRFVWRRFHSSLSNRAEKI